jgi:hypothetical protein
LGSREERIQAGSREIGSINFKGYARNVILKVKFSLDNKYSRVIFIGNAHINLVVNSPGEALLGRAVKPNVDCHDVRRRYLKQLLRINDELLQLCKFLNEKHDMETSSRLIPLVDDLTHILIEAGKEQITLMQQDKDISSRCGALPGSPTELNGQSTTNAPVPSVIIAK